MSESKHREASGECMLCFDDIEKENYCEYKIHEEQDWLPSGYCVDCLDMLIKSQWKTYHAMVGKETCRAALRRLIACCPATVKKLLSGGFQTSCVFYCHLNVDWIALTCPNHSKPIDPKVKTKDRAESKDGKVPCPTQGQVISVWNAADGTVFTPVLNGAPTGEERKKYIENLEVFALLLEDTENE